MSIDTSKMQELAEAESLAEGDTRQTAHILKQLQTADKNIANTLITLGPLAQALRSDLDDGESGDKINAAINRLYDAKQLVVSIRKKTKAAHKARGKRVTEEDDLSEADFKQRYGSSRNDDMVLLTQSGKLLPMQYVPGDSNYVYTKTKHKRYKRIAHNKRVSPRDALQKFQDWLKLDDD